MNNEIVVWFWAFCCKAWWCCSSPSFGRWLTETYRCLSSVEFVSVPVCFNATKTYWDNASNLVFAFWPVRSLSSSKMTCASQVGFAYEKLHTLLHLSFTVVVSHSSYSLPDSHSGKPSCNQTQKGIAKARCSQQISFWIWNLRTRSPWPASLYNLKPRRTTAWSPPPQVRSAWMIQTDILTCCQWRTALFEESQQDNRFTFTWTYRELFVQDFTPLFCMQRIRGTVCPFAGAWGTNYDWSSVILCYSRRCVLCESSCVVCVFDVCFFTFVLDCIRWTRSHCKIVVAEKRSRCCTSRTQVLKKLKPFYALFIFIFDFSDFWVFI